MADNKRDENGIVHVEQAKESRGCVHHLKKWWWLHLLIICAIVVLVVPLVILVGVKNIVQHKMNDASLSIEGIEVTQTHSQDFVMSINSTIHGSGGIKARIESFEGIMYLEDEPSHTPFATIQFPETHNVKVQSVNVSQKIDIANMDALTTFNTFLLDNDTVRVTVEGKPKVHVPGISHKYNAKFKKTVTLNGIKKFDGLKVTDGNITATTFSDGTNFHAVATIPNPSVVTFEIGNASFTTYLLGQNVGYSNLTNVILRPGDNVYPLAALIQQVPVITNIQEEPYCGDGVLPFVLSGKTVVNNGQSLSYFADALARSNTSVGIDLGTPLRNIGLDIKCKSS